MIQLQTLSVKKNHDVHQFTKYWRIKKYCTGSDCLVSGYTATFGFASQVWRRNWTWEISYFICFDDPLLYTTAELTIPSLQERKHIEQQLKNVCAKLHVQVTRSLSNVKMTYTKTVYTEHN